MTNAPLWDDQPWTSLPAVKGEARAEVCVVGLGGSGLAALEELQALGVDTIGIEARSVGAGAAGRNGGFVLAGMAKFYHETVALYGREAAATLYRLTAAEIARQDVDLPGVFKLNGSLRIAADAAEREDCRRHLAALQADGFPAEPYAGPEGEGLLLPQDGTFHPLARVRRMAGRLRERGVRLYENSPVMDLESCRVVAGAGVIRCRAVIVAVDGRLERILPELEGRVRTARLQMLATGPAPEVNFPRAVYRREGYEYWQQRPDGCIAFGGFRDHALEEEWTDHAEPTAFIQGKLEEYLRHQMKVRAPITHRWAASVGYTPDGLPILEEVRPKVWALGGYNGTGNIVGALCGRAAARLATGRDSEWGKTLAAARFHRT